MSGATVETCSPSVSVSRYYHFFSGVFSCVVTIILFLFLLFISYSFTTLVINSSSLINSITWFSSQAIAILLNSKRHVKNPLVLLLEVV